MQFRPEDPPSEGDAKSILSTANLASIKAASPLYAAETAGLRREIVRRERAGLDTKAYRNRLAASEQRLTLYSSEIALASKVGEVPDGSMVIIGVVTENGKPVEGLIVSAYDLDGNPVPPAVETGPDGSFVLTIRKDTDVRIVVSTRQLEVLHCHDVTFEFEEGRTHRTRIDLDTIEPLPIDPVYPCSEDENPEEDRVTVPDLSGMTRDEADATLEEAGLNGSYETEPSSEEDGRVIGQGPEAGTTVDRGTTVEVVLAEPARATVPDVVGQTRAAAENTLQPAFSVKVSMTRDGNTPGRVVRQVPDAGAEVELPATVLILVGEAKPDPDLRTVPDVVGMPHAEGQAVITEKGFSLGPVSLKSADGEAGRILDQSPEGGAEKPAGTPVALTISITDQATDPERRTLPDVVGHPSQPGANTVREAGFDNLSITRRRSGAEAGTIIAQNPPGDTTQSRQTLVTLVVAVNQPIDPTPGDATPGVIVMPDLTGASLSEANAGLKEAELSGMNVVFGGQSNTPQVTGQKPRAGARISGSKDVVLTISVPNTWRRDPSLAVSNLYRLHPASSDINATKDQEAMIARKLAAMPLEDIEAMLEKGEDGVAAALTKARQINRPSLVEAIRFAASAVRDNVEQ